MKIVIFFRALTASSGGGGGHVPQGPPYLAGPSIRMKKK